MRTLGELPPRQLVKVLRDEGYGDEADEIELSIAESGSKSFGWSDILRAKMPMWMNTKHAFGFVPVTPPGNEKLDIIHPGNMIANQALKGSRVTIKLDSLRVADYPGGGVHQILFDFQAKNYIGSQSESVRFNQTYRAMEGQDVGIIGYPVFVGLGVGNTGISFECSTINARNESDEAMIKFLDSDVFKAGLQLTTTFQPAIAPLAEMAKNIVGLVAKRYRDRAVQSFNMGLDFAKGPGGARLCEGLYTAVQVPETNLAIWKWDEWVYDQNNGRIINRQNNSLLIPYNYISFKIEEYSAS